MSEYPSYLIHYGIKGQRWGERRYQNEDGTWTEEGLRRRRIGDNRESLSVVMTGNKNAGVIKSDNVKFAKSIKADVQAINGGRKGHEYGFNRQENCAFCSISYELRRRGHDVRAQESLTGVQTALTNKNGAFGKVIPNFSKISKESREFAKRSSGSEKMLSIGMNKKEYNEMTETLIKDGEGARGFISIKWKDGYGGHIFNYEVNGGKLYFIDAQSGEIKKADNSYFNNVFRNGNNIATLRMDNVKMDEKKAEKYYSEKNEGDVRINKAKQSQAVKVGIGTAIGAAVGLGTFFPHLTAALGGSIVTAITEKKVKEIDEEASIELQKKWEKEGRFKEKWYDIKEEKKKDSNGNTISKNEQSRIRSLISSGKTQEEVARILGVSVSTINKYK